MTSIDKNKSFFEQFYDAHVKHHTHDIEQCELAYSSSSGLSLEPTSSYKFYHLWTTYSLPDNVKHIIDAAKTALDTLATFDKATPKERVVRFCQASSQTCFHIDRIVTRDLLKSPQDQVLPELHRSLALYANKFLITQATLLEAHPILVACQNGTLLAALDLFENHEDCLKYTKGYQTELLKLAYNKNHFALCRKLIQEGADPLAAFTNRCQEICTDFLFDAITDGQEDVALILVQSGANLQQRKQGKLALHEAAAAGFLPLLEKMIAKGAYVNATDFELNTPLHYAARALRSDAAFVLMKNGADATRLNAENTCAFYLADQHPDKAAASEFYSVILAEFAPLKERLLEDGITAYLTSCQESPATLVRGFHGPNPLGIALLFQDMFLAEKIAETMSLSRYFTYCKKLQNKYPQSNCTPLFFCFLKLAPSHFIKSIPQLELKAPSRDVSLNELLDFVTAPLKISGKAYSKAEITKIVRAFIDRIVGKADMPGLMNSDLAKKNQFYELLENLCLKTCIISLKDAPVAAKIEQALGSIIDLEVGEHCAGRYFGVLTKLARSITADRQLSFEDEVYLMLAEFRELVLKQCVDPNKESNRNDYNDLLSNLGQELGIPGFDSCRYFQDLHGHSDIRAARDRFFRYYTPASIIKDCLEPALKHNAAFRQRFEEWMMQQIPSEWGNAPSKSLPVMLARAGTTDDDIRQWLRKNGVPIPDGATNYEEAIKRARRAAYLRMEVYDEDQNIRPLALSRLLARLGTPVVTSSRLQEESSPKTFACDWKQDIIDMVRH